MDLKLYLDKILTKLSITNKGLNLINIKIGVNTKANILSCIT